MGPRSWDRGETHTARGSKSSAQCFNGAAVLGPRREELFEKMTDPRSHASMGPRSWDRGETAW